jgi:FkbM family methyltransferase
MISYAYNNEDVLLRRLFEDRDDGFFVDIGAHHPVVDSVTKHFSDLGWQGINVEPIPNRAELFAAQRPTDINLSAGVSDQCGEMTFPEVVDGATLSTFSDELAAEYQHNGYNVMNHQVPVLTLAVLFEQHVNRTVDFLCVDVEGPELHVLAGGNFDQWRPRVIVIESTRPGTSIPSHQDWEHLLLDASYEFATFDGVNRYYVRQEDRELVSRLSIPVNAFDEFIPYQQFLLEKELRRYRALNPVRRMSVWVSDVERAVRQKLRRRSESRRRSA